MLRCISSGSFKYTKAIGNTSLDPEQAKPLGTNDAYWTASFTKIMTSICAMQLVERGLVALDDPVSKYLPEIDAEEVITSVDADGKATLEKQKQPVTLRMLLTHTSGKEYDFWSFNVLIPYYKHINKPLGSGGRVLPRYKSPLVFQPGSAFAYGSSLDYVGIFIERVTGQSLEEYMAANLWAPLGLKDFTFRPSQRPDIEARIVDAAMLTEAGKVTHLPTKLWTENGVEWEDNFGGMGCITTPEEWLKFMRAVLRDVEEEKVLKKASWKGFIKPQLNEQQKKSADAYLKQDLVSSTFSSPRPGCKLTGMQFHNIIGAPDKSVELSWALGAAVTMQDSPMGQKAGTLRWCGVAHMFYVSHSAFFPIFALLTFTVY